MSNIILRWAITYIMRWARRQPIFPTEIGTPDPEYNIWLKRRSDR